MIGNSSFSPQLTLIDNPMKKFIIALALGTLCLFVPVFSYAQGNGKFLDEIYNTRPSFAVRIEVDKPSRVYVKDEFLRTNVTTSKDGYLYLFYKDAEGNVAMLYPNRFNKKNAIQKGETVSIPTQGSIFQIRMSAPFGNELLKAVVSKEPLAFFDNMDLTGINMLPIGGEEGKELAKSAMALEKSDWAVHQVHIRNIDPDAPPSVVAPTSNGRARNFPHQRIIARLKIFRN